MKLQIAGFALAIAPLCSFAQAPAYPNGSYSQTCTGISVSANSLKATCRKLNGNTQPTVLDELSTCLNSIARYGDIGNIDGNLVCIPDLPKPDPAFTFPAAEVTINQWVFGGNMDAIHRHGWEIFAGLTHPVGVVDGTPVRAFETWATPRNMIFRMGQNGVLKFAVESTAGGKQSGLDLEIPRQFSAIKAARKPKILSAQEVAASPVGDTNIFVAVSYNPPAAQHAIANKLFLRSTLDALLREGYAELPDFPANSITLKPVYKVIPASTPGGIYTFPGWPGPPNPVIAFPEEAWGACVYVDIKGSGAGGNSIDSGCKGRNASNTFFLNNFVHQKISKENADFLNAQLGLRNRYKEGDYAILVAMHVTSREVKTWTWQSFWWSANPDQPYLPSSAAIAAQRPMAFLDDATRHYAMTVAYSMVTPAQPITGGQSVGEPVFGFNPHLEAGFDPSVFQTQVPIVTPSGPITTQYGVQSNCMTCHNQAMYNPRTDYQSDGGANRQTPYGADYYKAINDPIFAGSLKLDFAWSIIGSMQPPPPPSK